MMWRAFFLAIGIYLCIIGGECLVVDKAVFTKSAKANAPVANQLANGAEASGIAASSEFKPKEWMPWSFISTGAVIILYSFTIPRRVSS